LSRLSDKRLRDAVRTWTTVGRDALRPEALDLLDAVDLLHDHRAAESWFESTAASSPADGQPK
jgi:hypothetical protein